MAKNDGQIVIKKYANRRLYNTGTSTYVTLDDLAQMVKRGEDFAVQDAKSGDDITHFKLQKLLYYAQAWHLAMHNEALFSDHFEGWVHGPVCREIYERFRQETFGLIFLRRHASVPF